MDGEGVVGVDPLFTMDVVRDFMVANGGSVSNHALVTHFKSFLNDSQHKGANRQIFKEYVNTLAVVKLDASGNKMLVLKKKFRDSSSFRREPAAAKFLSPDNSRTKAKRIKKECMPEITTETDDPGQLESDSWILDDDKENPRKAIAVNVPELSTAGINVADDKMDEENEMSTDEKPAFPLAECSVNKLRACTPDDLGQSSDSLDMEHSDIAKNGSDTNIDIPTTDTADDDDIATRNVDESCSGDVTDSAGSLLPPAKSESEPPATETIVSVREMAKQLNKAESPSRTTPDVMSTPQRSNKVKRERDSRRNDDGGYEFFSLSEAEREWTIKSAYSDYQAMAKLLLTNPSLAGRHDFLSGYTALHWAAKNGKEEVVKLLFGCKEPPNVNARSHGGYTPLHIATMYSHDNVIRLLVEVYGANPNIRDYSGRKPKHYFAHSAVSARVQQLLQPLPRATTPRSGSNKYGRSVPLGSVSKEISEPLPSPGSSPGPSSRKGSVHSDSGLMPPPRQLPAVVCRRPVVSSLSVDSGVDHCGLTKEYHSDSDVHHPGSDTELHGSGSTPNFSSFV